MDPDKPSKPFTAIASGTTVDITPGLTIRQEIAMHIMAHGVGDLNRSITKSTLGDCANRSVRAADALIAELYKQR